MKKKTNAFDVFNVVLMALLVSVTLLPFLHVVSKAFSGVGKVTAGLVTVYPQDIQFDSLLYVLRNQMFLNSLGISLVVTVAGTVGAMIITVLTAYPLSKKGWRGRKAVMYLYIFVMLFSGGMVPNYLLFTGLKLTNTLFAMILPGLLSVYNMLIIKNYMEGLPESVEEAAVIDGASHLRLLFSIVLPMSMPVIATISLFYAVSYWNDYFAAMLYVTKQELKPLQLYLYELIQQSINIVDNMGNYIDMDSAMNVSPENIRSATIVVATVPILLLYPLLQKHFAKGITIGSVKG